MLRRHADGHYFIPGQDERETGTRQAADAGFRRPTAQPALEQKEAPEPVKTREELPLPVYRPQRCDPVDERVFRPTGKV